MTPPWTFPITRRDGTVIEPNPPMICDQFSDGMGLGVGTLRGNLIIADCTHPVDVLLQPDQCVVWPCWYGTPVGAFTVQGGGEFGPGSETASFTAASVDAELFERQIFSTLAFAQVDQRDIAGDLVRYGFARPVEFVLPYWAAQIQSYGPAAELPLLRLDPAETPPGHRVVRDVASDDTGWPGTKALYIGQALQDFAKQLRGFEMRLDYGREPVPGGRFYAVIKFGFPNLTGGPLPLEEGVKGNVLDWRYTPATGKGSRNMWRQVGKNADGTAILGPTALDEVNSDGLATRTGSGTSQSSDDRVLYAEAQAALRDRTGIRQGWTVDLKTEALTTYRPGWVGDLAVKHARFGGVKRTRLRIRGHTVYPLADKVTLDVRELR